MIDFSWNDGNSILGINECFKITFTQTIKKNSIAARENHNDRKLGTQRDLALFFIDELRWFDGYNGDNEDNGDHGYEIATANSDLRFSFVLNSCLT